MSEVMKLGVLALTVAMFAGCASDGPTIADAGACVSTNETTPPSATTPVGPIASTPMGPTAMNPPPGHPPLMNPTAPMQTAAIPSNMGYGGARTPSTAAMSPAGDNCNRRAGPTM